MNLIKELLSILLYSLVVGAVPIALKLLSNFVDLKQREFISSVESETAKEKLNSAIDLIQAIVLDVAQTYVDPLKEKDVFTSEAALEAKSMAIDRAKLLLSTDGICFLEGLYGDVDQWISTQIEATIKSIKIQ